MYIIFVFYFYLSKINQKGANCSQIYQNIFPTGISFSKKLTQNTTMNPKSEAYPCKTSPRMYNYGSMHIDITQILDIIYIFLFSSNNII